MRSFLAKFSARVNIDRNIFFQGIVSLLFRTLSIFASFAFTLVVTRSLSAEEAGLFFLAFALVMASSSITRLGLDNSVIRFIGADCSDDKAANLTLNTALVWVGAVATCASIVLYLTSDLIAIGWFKKNELTAVLEAMFFAVPLIAVAVLIGMGLQARGHVASAIFAQTLGQPAVSALFVVGYGVFFALSASSVGYLFFASAIVVVITGLINWFKAPNITFFIPPIFNQPLWESCSRLWAVVTMNMLVLWSGVLVVGYFEQASEVAFFSAAQRASSLISFILVVVNFVIAPQFASHWKSGEHDRLRFLAKRSVRLTTAIAFPFLLVMCFAAEDVMALFGPEYGKGALLLIIMAIGQFLNVATGSVGLLLSMSGHEGVLRRVALVSGPLTIGLIIVLTSEYGILGAAVGSAIGLAGYNLFALCMVRKYLGFWPLG